MHRADVTDKIAAAASGSLSGVLVSVIVQPLDVIRTRMQGDGAKGSIRGTIGTFRKIYQESGLLGFWRGTGPTVLRLAIGAGLHFVSLEMVKNLLAPTSLKERHESLHNALVGGLSRGGITVLLCPVTIIKTKMEYVNSQYTSTIHAATSIARKDGIRGLFKGLVPTFLSNAPFSAIHYVFYRKMQKAMYGENTSEQSFSKNFACATVAAAAATIITHPADVVRTRIQLGIGAKGGTFAAAATLKAIIVGQGLHGIALGVAPRMLKRTLQTAMIWTLYEELHPHMRRLMNGGYSYMKSS